MDLIEKILVIGSGPIRIGQAAEFDYSGSQACRALKEEGYGTILLNSNPATIQTDTSLADMVYLRPLTVESVEEILTAHKIYGVVATLGGQTGLNLCVSCQDMGLWDRYGVRVLGTSVTSILKAEGRESFRDCVSSIGEPVVESAYVGSVEEALAFAEDTPFPMVVRPDFTLGGTGGGVAWDEPSLKRIVVEGLKASPVSKVLVERYLKGWREIEVEVVRDGSGNSLAVCGMENVDPMGVHTGDSVVVSPVLSLNDRIWQTLRYSALRIVDSLDVRGACNVQFGLAPDGDEYVVIEVNPRASRSSALASKATGYPIARIAAKIALGRSLSEMPNPVTGTGSAMTEPALDYVVVKVPRFPFDTFDTKDRSLGTKMKATGEVLEMGLSFSEAWMKAMRSLGTEPWRSSVDGACLSDEELQEDLTIPTDRAMLSSMELFRRGYSTDRLARRSSIAPCFLNFLEEIVSMERAISSGGRLDEFVLRKAKSMGFSDRAVAYWAGVEEGDVRDLRRTMGIVPGYREVDGCAGEFPAGSGFWYGSYSAEGDVFSAPSGRSVAVLGSGSIRIGQGVEFDYCCVKAVEALRRRGIRAIMVNDNPETVSTDHDISDGLYVEPLTAEDVEALLDREGISSVFASFGGQTSLKVGLDLEARGNELIGISGDTVVQAEDRGAFVSLLDRLSIPYPKGIAVRDVKEGMTCGDDIGYPLMVRPSFVIGGAAMRVVYRPQDLEGVLERAFSVDADQEVLIDRFLTGKEFEVDVICDGEDVFVPGIFEHLDPAGIHSGDSMAVFPDISLSEEMRWEIANICESIGKAMNVKGLLNVQMVLHGGRLWVIEANPRASRTVPIAAKLTGLPLVDIAVGVGLGEPLSSFVVPGIYRHRGPMGVKVPVFSTEKIPGAEVRPGPRMSSTGESLGLGESLSEALREAWIGAGWSVPRKGKVLFSVDDGKKAEACAVAALFESKGWEVEGTPGTASFLSRWGVCCRSVVKKDGLSAFLNDGRWDLVVNLPGPDLGAIKEGAGIRRNAMETSTPCLFSLEAASAVAMALNLT